MSNVIQFLESLGRNPLPSGEYGAAVAALKIEDGERQALFDCDGMQLNELLSGRTKMYFMVATPHEDVPEDSPEDSPEFPDEPVRKKDH